MPPCSPVHPPSESHCPSLGLSCTPPGSLPFSSASGGTALPRRAGHVTHTKAHGWVASAIRHVVLLGVGGQARREEE